MLIYLIGLPGVGKTTIGKQLSKKLNFSFFDLDTEIEKSVGVSIPQIFEINGESHFREIEKQELHKTLNLQNTIIATGGGTPCFFNNMDVMNKAGKTIYLESEPSIILDKLSKNDINNRPIFNDINDLNFLYMKRKVFYEKAHESLLVSNKQIDECISLLINKIR